MDSATYQHAALSAGLWFAFVYGVTAFDGCVSPGFAETVVDAAIVAASSVGKRLATRQDAVAVFRCNIRGGYRRSVRCNPARILRRQQLPGEHRAGGR